MDSYSARAYAKLNLCLDITGKRPDGYHLLETIMQSISVYDTISVCLTQSGGIQLCCSRPELPCGKENTAIRAALTFFSQHSELSDNIEISLIKRIPQQAGMGGGSADAAAVLHILNKIFKTNHSIDELCGMGLEIGADVPFCIKGGTMLANGIGEILTPLTPLPDCYFVICKPAVGISTGKAFLEADRRSFRHPDINKMEKAICDNDLSGICDHLFNVFEELLSLEIIERIRKRLLEEGAQGACMTGSGSAVFGVFQEEHCAKQCYEKLSSEYDEVFLCKPVRSGSELVKNNI